MLLFVGLSASCDKTAQPDGNTVLAEESESLPPDLSAVTAAETMNEADVTCVPLKWDGKCIGFEMRFLQSAKLDALFSDEENMYYGVVRCGKKQIGVPMEQVRILTDGETREFVLTLLLPTGGKLSGKTCAVSFYTAKRSGPVENALFCAQKEISLS